MFGNLFDTANDMSESLQSILSNLKISLSLDTFSLKTIKPVSIGIFLEGSSTFIVLVCPPSHYFFQINIHHIF